MRNKARSYKYKNIWNYTFWYEKYFIWTLNSLNSDEVLQYIHCKTNDLDEAEEITYTIDLEPLNLWELFNFLFLF